MILLPLNPGSPQPKSSAIHRMIFGLEELAVCCEKRFGVETKMSANKEKTKTFMVKLSLIFCVLNDP